MSLADKQEILQGLKAGITELTRRYERLKEENMHLFNENQKLIEINKQKDIEFKKIKEKLETFKLGEAFVIGSQGSTMQEKKHEAKIKINRILKDIDRCITILSK